MDRIQSEALVLVFKTLDSDEMVIMKRVCKRWFEIIERTESLWTRLVLPEWDERDSFPIDLFDRKSQSSLQEVSIHVGLFTVHESSETFSNSLIKTLARSKKTLKYLRIYVDSEAVRLELSQLSWQLPNLIECIIEADRIPLVRVKDVTQFQTSSTASLRTLWFLPPKFFLQSRLHLLSSVISLHLEEKLPSKDLKRILGGSAPLLRELSIKIKDPRGIQDQDQDQLLTLDFPNLRVLTLSSEEDEFPSWMKIPPDSKLILDGDPILKPLPSISMLWLSFPLSFRALESACPLLSELRISDFMGEAYGSLISMLRAREHNVEIGKQVDGVRMTPLKKLVIDSFDETQVPYLRRLLEGLIEEVVDLSTVGRFLEVEI